jgi:oligopeptide/dipeptide ABC transporter ATP-binding protein
MSPLLSARLVTKHFPVARSLFSRSPARRVHAVDGVDLDLVEDETVALVGESGSGKTTLSMLLLGLQTPTAGVVQWSGRSLADLNDSDRRRFRRDVQVVFQDPYGSLNPRMTVGRTLGRPLRFHRVVPEAEVEREVVRLLELVGLAPAEAYLDRFPHEFSGGQRQRIAIARALALRPRMIIADEPVSALDVSVRAQILALLATLKRERRIAMLFTTHDLGVVRYIADRVVVMYLGKVVEIAPSDRFFSAPQHPYSRVLLGSALSPNPGTKLEARMVDVRGEPPSPIDPPSGCRFRTRCPHAFVRCETEEPMLRIVGPDHRSACHLSADGELAILDQRLQVRAPDPQGRLE